MKILKYMNIKTIKKIKISKLLKLNLTLLLILYNNYFYIKLCKVRVKNNQNFGTQAFESSFKIYISLKLLNFEFYL